MADKSLTYLNANYFITCLCKEILKTKISIFIASFKMHAYMHRIPSNHGNKNVKI